MRSLKFIANRETLRLRPIRTTEQKSVVGLFEPCTNEFQSRGIETITLSPGRSLRFGRKMKVMPV